MRSLLYCFMCLCTLVGCGGEDTAPLDLRLDYYPIDIGQEFVYRMDSVIYDPTAGQTNQINTTSYRRERIVDSTILSRGEIEYSIEISTKESLADAEWEVRSFDRVSRFGTELFRTYGNQRFIPLNFPPEQGARWDGLAFIDDSQVAVIAGEPIKIWEDWGDYEINSPAGSVTHNGIVYDDVVRVVEVNFDDEVLILRESFAEYASDVGLVFRQQRIFDLTCSGAGTGDPCRDTSIPWEDDAEMGFSLRQTLISQ